MHVIAIILKFLCNFLDNSRILFSMGKEKLKVKRRAFSLFFLPISVLFFGVNFSTPVFAIPTPNAPIPLSLDQAVQRMIENNLNVKTLALSYESAQIGYDIAWNAFYMPNFTFGLNSTSAYTMGTRPFTAARTNPDAFNSKGYPTSAATLALGSYTLFNFFRDRAAYDIAKLSYERSKSIYQEQLRSSKFSLTNLYFQTKIAQEKLEASERSMTISQAIAELVESRKSLGKATEDEQNSAAVDLLNAKVAYSLEKRNVAQISVSLNTTLNATPETEFRLTSEPPFVPVELDEKHLFDVFKTQSPSSKNAELNLTIAEMNASLAEKSRLPLPTLSFSGITLSYNNAYSGGSAPAYTSSNSTFGALEVAATVALSIPIFGPNGFFNEKSVRNSYIQRDIQEISQRNTMMNGELTIRQSIATIKQIESQIKTLRESLVKSAKILDNIFKKASSSSTDRLQLRDALLQARQTELSYLDSLLSHISEKNNLSNFVGLDRLPGDQL
jgi:outer membrane protein TolC